LISFSKTSEIVKYRIFKFFLFFGINIFKSKYDLIPQATRFMRNIPLLENIFELLKLENKEIKCFFHAASTGEEVYSFLIFNDLYYKLKVNVMAGEYEKTAYKKIKEAIYSRDVIEKNNKAYVNNEFLQYFIKREETYHLCDEVKRKLAKVLLCDYTIMDEKFIQEYTSDIVFCNNTLLYHEFNIQKEVLEKLCVQSKKYLVITGVENKILENVLVRYGFYPYKKDWELIYDNWKLRRRASGRIYPTPTTPYLTDDDKNKEHYFKYSIFIKKEQ
jgi:chemotaxis methyl-accepting protein methylase